MIVMRRREGDNWFHVSDLADDAGEGAGAAVVDRLTAYDFLKQHEDDAKFLSATLTIPPNLTMQQTHTRSDNHWEPTSSLLRADEALPMDVEVDLPILAFLNQIDGRRSLNDCIEDFAGAVGANVDKLKVELLPAIRQFVGRGVLAPVSDRS